MQARKDFKLLQAKLAARKRVQEAHAQKREERRSAEDAMTKELRELGKKKRVEQRQEAKIANLRAKGNSDRDEEAEKFCKFSVSDERILPYVSCDSNLD